MPYRQEKFLRIGGPFPKLGHTMMSHLLRALVLTVACAATASAQAVLRGYVREDSTLRPLQDAEVLADSLAQSARTDKSGRFTLRDVPLGARSIHIRRVGFEPLEVTLQIVAGTQEAVYYLKRPTQTLDTVTVDAPRPRGLGRESFGERRNFGLGKFLDSTDLRPQAHKKLQDLLPQLGVRVAKPIHCGTKVNTRPPYCDTNPMKRIAVAASMSYECPMQVMLDGVAVYRPTGVGAMGALSADPRNVEWESTFDVGSVMVSSLESVEIYRRSAEVPTEFGGSNSACGVLVLWLRRR